MQFGPREGAAPRSRRERLPPERDLSDLRLLQQIEDVDHAAVWDRRVRLDHGAQVFFFSRATRALALQAGARSRWRAAR